MTENIANEAITDIVNRYTLPLFSYIRCRVETREDAEDILQDVFCQLSRTFNGGDSSIGIISGWLYRVTHNSILNLWRKKRLASAYSLYEGIEALSEMLTVDMDPETDYLRKLVWLELEYALAELPAEQSEVFCMTVFEGIPVKVIAGNLGIPVATVLSRKHYAVKHLRIRLKGLYDDLMNL